MPATNYTPIQLYRSTTSGNVPSAANLSAGEIALNIADNDMTMYFENASGTVKSFFNNPAALKYPTADGTSGQIIQTNGAGVLSFGSAPSSALTNNTRQAVTSSATTTINLNSGNVIDLTMAANITTLSFTNVPASGTPILIQIVVRNASDGTAYTIVWPNSVYWSGQYAATTLGTVQTAPTLASGANGVTTIALLTTDGGTKWRGWVEATIPGGSSGELYTWSQNNFDGQLMLNNQNSSSSPIQVGSLINWSSRTTGYSNISFAIKTDGTLWGAGNNASFGTIGDNTIINRSSPVQIGTDTNWSVIAATSVTAVAIKTTGTMWSWGSNDNGALGQNVGPANFPSELRRSSPVQIGSLNTWESVSINASGVVAKKTDGTLWSWGNNTGGALGDNSSIKRSSPVQITTGTDWAQAFLSGGRTGWARKTDGTLWAWGSFNYGQRMIAGADISSPTQVGAGVSGWTHIGGGSQTFNGIKDGNIYIAGRGTTGTGGASSSPIQITSSGDWAQVTGRNSFTTPQLTALKTNGTLWEFRSASSPTQVGTATNWASNNLAVVYGYPETTNLVRTLTINPA
jgi:hypothetical protein